MLTVLTRGPAKVIECSDQRPSKGDCVCGDLWVATKDPSHLVCDNGVRQSLRCEQCATRTIAKLVVAWSLISVSAENSLAAEAVDDAERA